MEVAQTTYFSHFVHHLEQCIQQTRTDELVTSGHCLGITFILAQFIWSAKVSKSKLFPPQYLYIIQLVLFLSRLGIQY